MKPYSRDLCRLLETKADMLNAADKLRSRLGLEGHMELTELITDAKHPSELADAARRIGCARRRRT